MNRTIKEATVKRFHYDNHDQLRRHLADFVAAYNFARRLKTLRGLTPYEASAKPGQTTRPGSRMTRTTELRDQTSRHGFVISDFCQWTTSLRIRSWPWPTRTYQGDRFIPLAHGGTEM